MTMAERKSNTRLTKAPHTLPSRASYGVSFVRILKKIDHVITVPQRIMILIVQDR